MDHLYILYCLYKRLRKQSYSYIISQYLNNRILYEDKSIKAIDNHYACLNLTFTSEEILSFKTLVYDYVLGSHPNITWDIVLDNPHIEWDYRELSSNPNITWDIIQANPDKLWDYYEMSYNPNITWDIVQANSDKNWSKIGLGTNPNITIDIIKNNHRFFGWDNIYLRNVSISEDVLLTCLDPRCAHYYSITHNVNITREFIDKNKDLPWRQKLLCTNGQVFTWHDICSAGLKSYYDLYAFGVLVHNFNRYNASQKIKHTFRHWKSKTRVGACTQVLLDSIFLDGFVPVEIVYHITSYID